MNSKPDLAVICRRLDHDSMTYVERSVTVAEAREVLNAFIGRDVACGPEQGMDAARMLTGFYPAREVNDFKAYAAGMAALLGAYPLDFVRRVCNPVDGLPSRLKWLPTLADVKAALEDERARRDRIGASALHVINEADRRRVAAEREREYQSERAKMTPEQRAELAERLTKGLRAMT